MVATLHNYNLRQRKLVSYVDVNLFTDITPPLTPTKDEKLTYPVKKMSIIGRYLPVSMIIIFSIITRLYAVTRSNIVVWDEAHFGKFANWYLMRTFYFDVHPPLGKMLIALFGFLFKYDGSFPFESGSTFTDNVPFGSIRMACALFGAVLPPFMYGICRNLGMKKEAAFFISILALVDNAFIVISKFILLDPILLAFTSMSIFSATKFSTYSVYPFTRWWKIWLFLTGFSLGLTTSVKWVGLFTYAFVGLFTIGDLWENMKMLNKEKMKYAKHWMYRIAFLIVLPIVTYMATFVLHFMILNKSGPGDAHMSSLFQSTLAGTTITNGPPIIGFESIVTIRNRVHGAGLLHSHKDLYPSGSKQPQVTLYHHRDHNNYWVVKKQWSYLPTGGNDPKRPSSGNAGEGEDTGYIHDKDVIRLLHNSTMHNLHSHPHPAPISVFHNEVSTYGNSTIGDDKDAWMIEIVENGIPSDIPYKEEQRIRRLSTTFRLKHVVLGCYLASTGAKLPEWGFDQMEVVCTKDDNLYRRTLWNIEEHINDSSLSIDEEGIPEVISPTFMQNFLDLNMAMWYGNNALTPKPGKKDLLTSTPSQWPFAHAGIRMCNWNDDTAKYYMLGNPLVWWTASSSIGTFIIHVIVILVKKNINGYISYADEKYISLGGIILGGWLLHYIPFWIMGRVTYLHHYIPALEISLLLVGHQCDRFLSGNTRKSWIITICLCMIYVGTFLYFSPITYGFIGKAEEMSSRVWRESWNLAL